MSRYRILALVLLGFGAAACGGGDDDGGFATPPQCNPLGVGASCAMPLPSSVYLVDDQTTATGFRLDFAPGSLPTNFDDIAIEPELVNGRDGFSANSPLVVAFGVAVDPADLPPITDPAQSMMAASPTVVLDMVSGERVVHFAEVDVRAADLPEEETLIIRPLVRLKPNHRYAVAVRSTLKAKGGAALPISEGFQAILDGTVTSHARLERVRPRYDAIFASLSQAGVPREELVVAWDFVTASDESIQSDMLTARDRALDAMGEAGANLTFQVTKDEAHSDTAVTLRLVGGTFDVPLVLTDDGGDDSVLARDGEGKPMVVGTYSAPFYAVIPACAATAPKPLPVVVFGHGLMGSGDEIWGGYVRKFANTMCAVVVATDWRGMSDQDVMTVALALNNANNLPKIMERLVQGILSYIALEQIARGPFAEATVFQEGGEPLIDPTRVFYYGISQGGIFGGTFMAYDPFVTRGVLHVGAAAYSMMLERSSDWPVYSLILGGAYPSLMDQQILLILMQMGWDLTEPATVSPGLLGVNADPIPNTPAKQILMSIAIGDSQVPNVASETQARSMGIPLLGPALYEPYGLTATAGPLPSAFTMYREDRQPEPPLTNTSLEDNGTHGSVRKLVANNAQIITFLTTGEVVQTCEKNDTPVACDCTDPEICGPEITGIMP